MKYGKVDINTLVSVVEWLNGEKGINAVLGGDRRATMKYGELTLGQIEALVNTLGGLEVVMPILRGEKKLSVHSSFAKRFDERGRCIPSESLQGHVTNANDLYELIPSTVSYEERFANIVKYLQITPAITAVEFEQRSRKILEWLSSNDNLKQITNGIGIPFFLPQLDVRKRNLLPQTYLEALHDACKDGFPKHEFSNQYRDKLYGNVNYVSGSRYEMLLEAMAKGDVVGIYFPTCLQGYSVDAAREQLFYLPEKFILAGGVEIITAIMGDVKILHNWMFTLLLDFSALQWKYTGLPFTLNGSAISLEINLKEDSSEEEEYSSSGLIVLG